MGLVRNVQFKQLNDNNHYFFPFIVVAIRTKGTY